MQGDVAASPCMNKPRDICLPTDKVFCFLTKSVQNYGKTP